MDTYFIKPTALQGCATSREPNVMLPACLFTCASVCDLGLQLSLVAPCSCGLRLWVCRCSYYLKFHNTFTTLCNCFACRRCLNADFILYSFYKPLPPTDLPSCHSLTADLSPSSHARLLCKPSLVIYFSNFQRSNCMPFVLALSLFIFRPALRCCLLLFPLLLLLLALAVLSSFLPFHPVLVRPCASKSLCKTYFS